LGSTINWNTCFFILPFFVLGTVGGMRLFLMLF
jgi:hypothetical protein